MKTALKALSLLVASSLWSAAAPRFEDISEAKIEYWKWSAGRTVSYWDIVFSAEEIKPLQELVRRAKPVDSKDVAWFITSLEGVLTTKDGKFEVRMGDEKIARQTYRISITPILKGARAKTEHFHLSKSDGSEYQAILDKLIAPRIKRKPDRTVEHK